MTTSPACSLVIIGTEAAALSPTQSHRSKSPRLRARCHRALPRPEAWRGAPPEMMRPGRRSVPLKLEEEASNPGRKTRDLLRKRPRCRLPRGSNTRAALDPPERRARPFRRAAAACDRKAGLLGFAGNERPCLDPTSSRIPPALESPFLAAMRAGRRHG